MIAEIENAMIAAIKALQDNGTLGYRLAKLDSYGGEFADGLERAAVNFPAILIVYGGGPISQVGQSNWKHTCRFMVICAAGNLRNEKASRHGEAGKVGSYQIAQDVVKILGGQAFGLDIAPLYPVAVRPLVNDKAGSQLVSVYGVDFETAFYLGVLPEMEDLGAFQTFHANWDIPVFGNVDKDIPSDDTADATDHVTLPQ